MEPREFAPNIFALGYIDWDRRLFESLIPLPNGTSYNSYVVKGSERTALIDTVNPPVAHDLLHNLEKLGIERLDYIVANHAEQDHSGSLPHVIRKYPDATIVCTERCKGLLIDLLHIDSDKFKTVADKETISLGDRTLEFIHLPWVHWPETMGTYLKEEKLLFSCDFFGSHLAATDLFVVDEKRVYEANKRYYAEIMMPFRKVIQNNLKKLESYEIKIIAPSHGPLYDKPETVMKAYAEWASDEPKNIVTVPYVSMHGSTRQMVEHLVSALAHRGVTVEQFDLSSVDLGKLAMSLVDAATVVIATPTMLAGPHPSAAYAAVLANALRPKVKFAAIIGSYGWGGKTVEILTGLISNLKVELLPAVIVKGQPKDADYEALDALADTIAQKHKEAGLK
jgi:flavorubredoxin